MNKKPELFINKIDRNIKNNDRVYYSSGDNQILQANNSLNLISKINNIFSSPDYVYKAEVKIKLKDKTVVKKIVGRSKSHLITMDNELITISDILDIEKNN